MMKMLSLDIVEKKATKILILLDLSKNFLYNTLTVNLQNDVIFMEIGGAKDETYLATK